MKKIKIPRLKTKVLAFVYLFLILFSLVFVEKKQTQKVCQKVNIYIDTKAGNYFIEEIDVTNILTNNNKDFLINNIHKFINLRKLENKLRDHGFVEKAIISKNLKGDINVRVFQYEPIARLIKAGNNGNYITDKGKILPLSDRFTARVLIIYGDFTHTLAQKDWHKDPIRKPYLDFILKIEKDEFLEKLVASVEVQHNGEINIYPQIGSQTIEFGKPQDLDAKLAVLKSFYKEVVPIKGWNTYKKVSLKYNNQLVCERY
jgi:cell division protein FtsQ